MGRKVEAAGGVGVAGGGGGGGGGGGAGSGGGGGAGRGKKKSQIKVLGLRRGVPALCYPYAYRPMARGLGGSVTTAFAARSEVVVLHCSWQHYIDGICVHMPLNVALHYKLEGAMCERER